MQRTITVTAVLVLILVGIAVKAVIAPTATVAGTHDTTGSIASTVSVYDLHVAHPGMNTMPVQAAPLP